MVRYSGAMRQTIYSTLLIAVVVTAFFYFSHSKGVREALERERRRAAEALQAETAARLALLQAQIEPHFLFNTLANIHSLIEQEPKTASRILEELNYLREPASYPATDIDAGEEIELIEALLSIAAAGLGRRLQFAELLDCRPLLLQPAGGERDPPWHRAGGGRREYSNRCAQESGGLELVVTDTGIGLNENAPEGVGLANVRARLASLYGAAGRLALYANNPHGVIAKLAIPVAEAK